MSTILGFIGFLVATHRLLVDPRQGFNRARLHRAEHRLIPTADEVRRFLETIEGEEPWTLRDRALFELLYSTGLRAGEACRLDLYDVDFATSTVTVRRGKGGYTRAVPLGREAAFRLTEYLKKGRMDYWTSGIGEAVFVTRRGCRLEVWGVGRSCQKWAQVSNVTHITAHKLRHAMATHMLQGGADVRHVQKILGHQEITTTQRYTHLVITDLKEAHTRCHPRGA